MPAHMSEALGIPALRSRSTSSSAALFVNVRTRIWLGCTCFSSTRYLTRWMSVVVLPVPGPATTFAARSSALAAASWSGLGTLRALVVSGTSGRSSPSSICCRTNSNGMPSSTAISAGPFPADAS